MSKAAASGSTETVKVMVRVRPMNTKEKQRGIYFIIEYVLFRLQIMRISRLTSKSSLYIETR